MTQDQKEQIRTWRNKILNKLWFAVYGLPICFGWYHFTMKIMLDFTISRDVFPEGIFIGIVWLITNGLIWIAGAFICMIPAAVIFGVVWTMEKQIVTKVMSPKLRKSLNLEDYKNIFDNRLRRQKSKN